MEWVRALQGAVVALDTAPLIYYIEAHPAYLPLIDPFFSALAVGEFQVVTSIITLTECLIHPIRTIDMTLANQYRTLLFDTEGITTLLVSPAIAELAAQLRATYNVRTPDAL